MSAISLCLLQPLASANAADEALNASAPAAVWGALVGQRLLFGDGLLRPGPADQHHPDCITTAADRPALVDVLRIAARHGTGRWWLLWPADATPSAGLLQTLAQLCAPGAPRRLVGGRAWHGPPGAQQLAPPGQFSWLLIPAGVQPGLPLDLAADPEACAGPLATALQASDVVLLDATDAAPLQRITPLPDPGPHAAAAASVLPQRPDLPRLSLLLQADPLMQQQARQQLLPGPPLPWELLSGWHGAIAQAQGELIWPLAYAIPPLALLPKVLQALEAPGCDVLLLAAELAGQWRPPDAACALPVPGTVVLKRRFCPEPAQWQAAAAQPPAIGLGQLLRQARQAGAGVVSLPLTAVCSSGSVEGLLRHSAIA